MLQININDRSDSLFTIGYSSFSIDEFIKMIKLHNINAIADVRSVPYSKFKPDFNRENLKKILNKNKIAYVFLGHLCGARIDAPECYRDGQVDFNILKMNSKFQEGIKRLKSGIIKYNIALMCAEKDPLTCHRTILICRNLRSYSLNIFHILDDGRCEKHSSTEERLLKIFKLNQLHLFDTEKDLIERAYDLQANKIAYKTEDEEDLNSGELWE